MAVVRDPGLPAMLRAAALDVARNTYLDVPPQVPIQLVQYTRVWSTLRSSDDADGGSADSGSAVSARAGSSSAISGSSHELEPLIGALVDTLDEVCSRGGAASTQLDDDNDDTTSTTLSPRNSNCDDSHNAESSGVEMLLDSVLLSYEQCCLFGLCSLDRGRDQLNHVAEQLITCIQRDTHTHDPHDSISPAAKRWQVRACNVLEKIFDMR